MCSETTNSPGTNGAQTAPLVRTEKGLRGVLNDKQALVHRQVHHGVHVARVPPVVHHDDGLGLAGQSLFDGINVDIQVISDIHKDWRGHAQGNGVGRGDERERGHDDLVAGPNVAKQHGLLQRRRGRQGQQGLGTPELRLQPVLAGHGVFTQAIQFVGIDEAAKFFLFVPREVRNVVRTWLTTRCVSQM